MIYLKKFDSHASYETEINGGGVDISLPNVSYCEDVKDIHYNPYNTVEFYVGEVTEPKTVKIYTDRSTSVDVTVSEGNKWYTYLLPKDKGLYKIKGDSVKKVVVKSNISCDNSYSIIPHSTLEASFKGSNTSNVTNMSSMFQNCSGLTELDISSFDTSNVIDMDSMFYFCSGLTSLDVSSFNTSNVTDMNFMFEFCSGLKTLDLTNFKTSNVTNMGGMFSDCSNLTSLDLSGWNTSNVTNMGGMFRYCSNLTSLDLSGWVIGDATSMGSMFSYCSNLTSLDLSGWVIGDATDMGGMFDGCSSLTTIRMVGCSQTTIDKISAVMPSGASISTV